MPFETSTFNDAIHILNTTMATTPNDTKSQGQPMPPPRITEWFRQTVFLAYIATFLVGGIGNALVCFILVTRKQKRRSIHLLTLNLAVSDLVVTVIYLPTQMYLLKTQFTWGLGEVTCRVVYGLNSFTINASIGTLLVITYDRYIAVTKPMVAHRRNTKSTKIMICIVWVMSMVVTIPLLLVTSVHMGYCVENWPTLDMQRGYWVAVFVVQVALPLIYISITYSIIIYSVKISQNQFVNKEFVKKDEEKTLTDVMNNNNVAHDEKKTLQKSTSKLRHRAITRRKNCSHVKRKQQKNKLLKMSIVLVITYGVCVSPQHAVFFAQAYGTFGRKPYAAFIFILSNFLMSMNSAINPCVYGILNDELKNSIIKVLTLKNTRNRLSRNVNTIFDTLRETIRKRFKFSRDDSNCHDSVIMLNMSRQFEDPRPFQC